MKLATGPARHHGIEAEQLRTGPAHGYQISSHVHGGAYRKPHREVTDGEGDDRMDVKSLLIIQCTVGRTTGHFKKTYRSIHP